MVTARRAERLDRELAYLTTFRDLGAEVIRQPLTALLVTAAGAKALQKMGVLTDVEANLLIAGLFSVEALKALPAAASALGNAALIAGATAGAGLVAQRALPGLGVQAMRALETGGRVATRALPAAGAAVLAADAIPLIRKNVPNALDEMVKIGETPYTLAQWQALPWWKRIFARRPSR